LEACPAFPNKPKRRKVDDAAALLKVLTQYQHRLLLTDWPVPGALANPALSQSIDE